jgi:hypothetical protein
MTRAKGKVEKVEATVETKVEAREEPPAPREGVVSTLLDALADRMLQDMDVPVLRAAITSKLVDRLLHDETLLEQAHAALTGKLADKLLDSVMQEDIVEAILRKSLQVPS